MYNTCDNFWNPCKDILSRFQQAETKMKVTKAGNVKEAKKENIIWFVKSWNFLPLLWQIEWKKSFELFDNSCSIVRGGGLDAAGWIRDTGGSSRKAHPGSWLLQQQSLAQGAKHWIEFLWKCTSKKLPCAETNSPFLAFCPERGPQHIISRFYPRGRTMKSFVFPCSFQAQKCAEPTRWIWFHLSAVIGVGTDSKIQCFFFLFAQAYEHSERSVWV